VKSSKQFEDHAGRALKGHFKADVYKDGVLIDSYEEDNMIMDSAREDMAEIIAGFTTGVVISKLKIGTRGHNTVSGDILSPTQPGSNGFIPSKTSLYSEADGSFFYTISWDVHNPVDVNGDPVQWNNGTLNLSAIGNKENQDGTENDAENAKIPVQISMLGRKVTYTVEVPEVASNGNDGASTIAYTEAALYAGPRIFSMKTMSSRVKDQSSKLVIKWSISV